jgi:hypothetical protein
MKDYQKRAKFSKGQIMVLQSKLKIREEELKELRSHYFEREELQRAMVKVAQLEITTRVLERSNEALVTNNEVLIIDNT